MNMPRPIGGNVSARSGMRVRLAMPQARIRKKRGGTFILCDDGGAIRYSQDGLNWRLAAASGAADAKVIREEAGVVGVHDSGGSLFWAVDLRGPWMAGWTGLANTAFRGICNRRCVGTSSLRRIEQNIADATWGTGVNGLLVKVGPDWVGSVNGTGWFQHNTAQQMISSVDPGVGWNTTYAGEVFGQYLLIAGSGSSTLYRRALPSFDVVANETLPFNAGAGAVCRPIAVGSGLAVIVGAGGGVAVLTQPEKVGYSGTVGFTVSDLKVCLYNGEAFVAAGDGGVVGMSLDGVNWRAGSYGSANNIQDGCVSQTIFP
jgi:hypothetical protein